MDDDIRTLWCGNLSDKVTESILYELFLQVNSCFTCINNKSTRKDIVQTYLYNIHICNINL